MSHGNITALSGEQGFTLIEVLITAAIMAIGLLAMAQMQIVAIRNNADTLSHTQAMNLAVGQVEYLKNLAFEAPPAMQNINDYWLTDVSTNPALEDTDGDDGDLCNVTGAPDHVHPDYPVDASGYPTNPGQEKYGMFWTIEE